MAKYQINYEALDADKNKENGTPYEEFLEWVETIIFAFFAVILIFTFLLNILSAGIPAWRTTRQPIVEALKGNE